MWTKFLRNMMAQHALKMSHCSTGGGASHCTSGETLYRKVGYGHCATYEPVNRGFGHPDWPRGTEVVVYARNEDREKALEKMLQMSYVVTKFVEVDGLQAEIMGEGRFFSAKADALRQPTPWEAPLSTAGRAWEDSMRNSVIYPSRELTDQMLGFPDMSVDTAKD